MAIWERYEDAARDAIGRVKEYLNLQKLESEKKKYQGEINSTVTGRSDTLGNTGIREKKAAPPQASGIKHEHRAGKDALVATLARFRVFWKTPIF